MFASTIVLALAIRLSTLLPDPFEKPRRACRVTAPSGLRLIVREWPTGELFAIQQGLFFEDSLHGLRLRGQKGIVVVDGFAGFSHDEFDRWFITKYGELFVDQANGSETYRIARGCVVQSVACAPALEDFVPAGNGKRLFSSDLEKQPELGSFRIEYSVVRVRSLLDCLMGRDDDFRKLGMIEGR
jgi:hypothetical protein